MFICLKKTDAQQAGGFAVLDHSLAMLGAK
jgi:hypothetical protein